MPCGSCNTPFYKDPFTSNCGDVCPDVKKKKNKPKNQIQIKKSKLKLKSIIIFFNHYKFFITPFFFF
jgi:hypothetical protein